MKVKKDKVKPEVAGPLKLDLACGDRKQPGFLGVDIAKTPSVDIVANVLEFPWKFAEDNSVDELYTSHFLEHIPQVYWNKGNKFTIFPEEGSVELFEKFFEECWRVLKPGGKMLNIAPYYSSIRCWQDPTHRRAISEANFMYLNKGWREANLLSHCHGKSNFDFSYGYNIPQILASRAREYQELAVRTQLNSAEDIIVTLTKIE